MNNHPPEQVRKYLNYLVLLVVVLGLFQEVGMGVMKSYVAAQQPPQSNEQESFAT